MTGISGRRSFGFLLFLSSISLQFISGFSNDSPSSKNGTKAGWMMSSSLNLAFGIEPALNLYINSMLWRCKSYFQWSEGMVDCRDII
ncbi:hypothetical protein F0562_029074 [Nyssa sinensis]|uniref:Uncharacterized protein n=1 Tax=Nyssa sinensis TaxID=561372 RepID=A0A5J5B2X3_9ASTE|nr:hypothetical protein F0562_029074 [Nyssa sinensis]